MAEKKDNDLQRIRELINVMKENDLVELELKHGSDKILLKRSHGELASAARAELPIIAAGASAGPKMADSGKSAAQELVEIKSPIVGTFYAAPSPDSEPFVEPGSHVEAKKTVVCIVEAMKVMNEIKAEVSGTITEILVKTGQAVEYGQVLFRIRPEY